MPLDALHSQDMPFDNLNHAEKMPFDNMNTIDDMPFDTEEIRLATEVAGAFAKTVKGKLYYSDDYPILKEYIAELDEAIRAYFYCYDLLELQVGECHFAVHDRIVYSTDDVSSSVPFLLFKDGVRTVQLMLGLDYKETIDFIELLRDSINLDASEDDIVTILMEKEFPHIEVVAVDDFLFFADSAVPLTVEEYRAHSQAAPMPSADPDMLDDLSISFRKDDDANSLLLDNGPAYRLTPEETAAMRKELAAETAPIGTARMAPVLFEMLDKENDRELFAAAADGISDFIERAMICGDYKKAAILHGHAQAFSSAYPTGSWQETILRRMIDVPGRLDLLQNIVPVLQREDRGQHEAIQRMLNQLTPSALPALIEMLASVRRPVGQDVIVAAISAVTAKRPEALAHFIEDPRADIALRVVTILGGFATPSCINYLARGLEHHSPNVRKAVVVALRAFDGAHTERVLIKALKDTDEGVRNAAAVELGRLKTMTALAPLLHAAQPKALRGKQLTEIKALLEGITLSGITDATPLLKCLLEDMPIIGKARADAIRLLAARALALSPHQQARALLKEGAESSKAAIRDACLDALKLAAKSNAEGSGK